VDLLSCLAIARLTALLACASEDAAPNKRVYSVALWLAALCPFTANYTAVPLTEVFATFCTALACCTLVIALSRVQKPDFLLKGMHLPLSKSVEYTALGAGGIVGAGTLFRPETPILLIAAVIVFGGLFFLRGKYRRWFWVCAAMALGCLMVRSPWAIRNMMTLGEPQFLAPRNSNLPGELVPYGFMAWEKTWLYRVRDCYLAPWKLNEESISVDDLPARAFDTPEEKERVAMILERYNNDLTLTPEEDAAFAQLASERTARHPLRTYMWLPAARAVTIWFTPRIELLPVSGHVFPLPQMREDDPVDQEVTSLFFLLNLFYVGLGVWGAARLWRANRAARPALVFLTLFILLRTAFLTTLETPEPRYVLVCFPALLALGAQILGRRPEAPEHS
jgi:4-amino-4-deoxy-L-arabinose transferase-like glycosyltransferase